MPVSVGPGATALTRTPEAATSIATDLVSPYTACLLAGGVNGGSGSPLVAVGRRDVDDPAAALSLHDAELMLQAEHRVENVGVECDSVCLC